MQTYSRRALVLVLSLGVAQGCATVPREAVDLSTTVGRDLEAVHRAHVALLNGYFDRMEADVNVFVDTKYRAYSIERNARDFDLVGRLKQPAEGLDTLDVVEVFVEELVRDIEDLRGKLLQPIRKQRAEVQTAVEEAYRRIQDAQAVVTGHLASVRRVHDLQEEMLAKANLDGLRDRFVNGTVKASEAIAKMTGTAEFARDKIDEFEKSLEQLKKLTESIGK